MECTQVITDMETKTAARLDREICTEHHTAIIGAAQAEYVIDKVHSLLPKTFISVQVY